MKFKAFILNEQEPTGGAPPMGGPPGLGGPDLGGGGAPPMGGPPGLGGPDLGGGGAPPMGGAPPAANEPPIIPKLANAWKVLDSILGTKKEKNSKESNQNKKPTNKKTELESPLMS